MPSPSARRRGLRPLSSVLGLALAGLGACGGSSELAAAGEAPRFELVGFNLGVGEMAWPINRPIELRFSAPVDFSSVSLNTVSVREQATGVAAVGTFEFGFDGAGLPDQQVLVFRPSCPREPSPFADAGLRPDASYLVRVLDESDGTALVSQSGEPLRLGGSRAFRTPVGLDPKSLFFDAVPGPPAPILRGVGATSASEENATRIEVGGPAGTRLYPVADGGGTALLEEALPLNLYSREESRVDLVVVLDQSVDGASVTEETVRLEALGGDGEWRALLARVELEENCTAVGAAVRLRPLGPLPPAAELRLFLSAELRDLRGDAPALPIPAAARFASLAAFDPLFDPPDRAADELLEEFTVGGAGTDSREDTTSLFADTRAEWGDDVLQAAFEFAGSGGPGGDFDWTVRRDEVFSFDTQSQAVTNPGQTLVVTAIGGELDVRDFTVEESGTLRIRGPNPFRMRVSGTAVIDGTIDVSGQDSTVFPSPGAANIPHTGGGSVGGSGAGGTSSTLTTTSTPRGDDGEDAFGLGSGGGGGESGFSASPDWTLRRPGGGGGGVFGPDELESVPTDRGSDGLAAQPGFPGMDSTAFPLGTFALPGAKGAESGSIPAAGGRVGESPFVDGDPANDFWGVRREPDGGLIAGELPSVWAGAGGGAGGDALRSANFPSSDFALDDRGGSGGSGGGSFHLLVLGDVVFGPEGEILNHGGDGGAGGSTTILNHVGGGAGGGSGGHLVVETNGFDDLRGAEGDDPALSAIGGNGGPGLPEAEDIGYIAVLGYPVNRGGDGGPGVIQLHVPGSTTAEQAQRILLPDGEELGDLVVPAPQIVLPNFGSRSQAQTRWIPLGGASPSAGSGGEPVQFRFGGTDPADGSVLDADGDESVDELPPLVEGSIASSDPATSRVRLAAAPLLGTDGDLYLRNPALLRNFTLRLGGGSTWEVRAAEYLAGETALELTVAAEDGDEELPAAGVGFALIPRFFRVTTSKRPDFLPSGARIQIQFQGAAADEEGGPAEEAVLVDWTGDVGELNDPELAAPIAFFRIRVLFDVDADEEGLDTGTLRPELEYVRVPFLFGG